MTEQLSPLALQALAIVEESGAIISANHAHHHTIRHKGRIDLVTETDIAVEAFLKERLATLTPEAGFLAEESAEDLSLPDTCWIIDPVDGTTNFAHGLPLTVTSVAYRLNGEIVLGIVNAPLLRECFIAEKGKGAWRNGERISVSSVAACENALVSTGFPYEIARRVDEILERMRPVLSSCQGVRRCGAAALDLAWTACGRFDAFYEDELKPWDMAAGALLVTEAGGTVSNLDGSPFDLRWSILAGNKAMHELIGKMIRYPKYGTRRGGPSQRMGPSHTRPQPLVATTNLIRRSGAARSNNRTRRENAEQLQTRSPRQSRARSP